MWHNILFVGTHFSESFCGGFYFGKCVIVYFSYRALAWARKPMASSLLVLIFFSLEWAYCQPNGKNAVRKCHPVLKMFGLHLLPLWYVTEMWQKCTLPEYSFPFVMAIFSLIHFFKWKSKKLRLHERYFK